MIGITATRKLRAHRRRKPRGERNHGLRSDRKNNPAVGQRARARQTAPVSGLGYTYETKPETVEADRSFRLFSPGRGASVR